jgi:hypothetical protein
MARRKLAWGAAIGAAALVLVGVGFVQYLGRARPAQNASADGLALSGYDPVSYFPEGGGVPLEGDPNRTAEHAGLRYQFASDENRTRFLQAPARYEPAFGGWCAHAVANGYKFEVDPRSFRIEGDRLLLFYDGVFGDARAEFEKQGVAEGLRKAETNWPALAAE